MTKHPTWRYLPSTGLLLGTFVYIAIAMRYRPEARAMPVLAGSSAAVLLAIDLISLTPGRIGARLTQLWSPERDVAEPPISGRRQLQALGWVAGFAALSIVLGVLPAIVLYVVASIRFFGRRPWVVALAMGVLITGFIWTLFAYVLRTPLYGGWLIEYISGQRSG